MEDPLRLLAVYVEEPLPGDFVWVVAERSGKAWTAVETSRSAQGTYREAMAGGLLALQGMVEDLDVGPRVQGGRQRRAGTETVPSPRDMVAQPREPAKRKRLFGFGPPV